MKYEALFFFRQGSRISVKKKKRRGSRRKCEADFFFPFTILQGFAKRSAACWAAQVSKQSARLLAAHERRRQAVVLHNQHTHRTSVTFHNVGGALRRPILITRYDFKHLQSVAIY